MYTVYNTTNLREELADDCLKSLLGPGSEPVNGCVVHQPWEISAASLEGLPAGGHAQHNVQVAGALCDEVRPHTLFGGPSTSLCGLVTDLHTG